jgi:hypothetical protein
LSLLCLLQRRRKTDAQSGELRAYDVPVTLTRTTDSFKYDPFGRRIYKSSSAGTSIFAYDGDNLIEEANVAGAVVARHSETQNVDEPLAMLRSGATSYYHADGLGSITSLGNAAGALAQTYTFDSFGKATATTSGPCRKFLEKLANLAGISVDALISQLQATASDAQNYVYDGPSSTVPLDANKFPGVSSPGVNTVGQSFDADPGQIALSQFNGSALFLSGDWGSGVLTGIFSPFANSNGSATPYGLGVLTHELLHKQSIGGGFSHANMNAALNAVGAQGSTLGRNDIADRIARLCFEGT